MEAHNNNLLAYNKTRKDTFTKRNLDTFSFLLMLLNCHYHKKFVINVCVINIYMTIDFPCLLVY